MFSREITKLAPEVTGEGENSFHCFFQKWLLSAKHFSRNIIVETALKHQTFSPQKNIIALLSITH